MQTLSAWSVALIVAVCTLLASELGYRMGRHSLNHNEGVDEAFGIVQNSVLGLMAFLLGFAFSFASGRYEARADLEQAEANAIGTAWMRTDMLDSPAREQMRALFPRYVAARIDFYKAGLIDKAAMAEKHAVCDALAAEMWRIDAAAFKAQPNPRLSLITQSLNEMFDNGGNVEENRSRQTPPVIFFLLFLSIVLGGGFIGFGFGRAGTRAWSTCILFVMVTSLVIYVVCDLLRPERGFTRATHDALIQLSDTFKPPGADPAAPPAEAPPEPAAAAPPARAAAAPGTGSTR